MSDALPEEIRLQLRELHRRMLAAGTTGAMPAIELADVAAGKADPWFDLYGKD